MPRSLPPTLGDSKYTAAAAVCQCHRCNARMHAFIAATNRQCCMYRLTTFEGIEDIVCLFNSETCNHTGCRLHVLRKASGNTSLIVITVAMI